MAHFNDAIRGEWRCYRDSEKPLDEDGRCSVYYVGTVFARCCPGQYCVGRYWIEPYGPFVMCSHKHATRWEAVDCGTSLTMWFLFLVARAAPRMSSIAS